MIIGCERSFAVRSPLKFRETWNTKLTLKLYAVCYIIFNKTVRVREFPKIPNVPMIKVKTTCHVGIMIASCCTPPSEVVTTLSSVV
jgi:hypothetical protein